MSGNKKYKKAQIKMLFSLIFLSFYQKENKIKRLKPYLPIHVDKAKLPYHSLSLTLHSLVLSLNGSSQLYETLADKRQRK